ncbi:ComEC/Rec2 family competence protein [Candidatus Solirubrobacter pratensis]|uniref:ComEC/Rec2 family competence protein n=1 Tax=Candidatus Solirubrobacter pratensis TaxID=1298857 RepID=UPI0004856804|nr:ComEC/Rec2 family competence protein [Candidatus Solirubrobacter pratensis]
MHAARALAVMRAHPRHLVLTGFVAGMLLVFAGPPAVIAAALAATAVAGRSRFALVAGAAVIAGAALAQARVDALDAGVLAHMHDRTVQTRVTLLEPVRERVNGPASARVRLLDSAAAGEQAVLRLHSYAYHGAWPDVGEVLKVTARVKPLGPFDAYQRRRNAHAALEASRAAGTGERRGGLAGVLDSVRRRAERGLEVHLAPKERALLRGMVLGEDERLSETTRDEFQASGLAHILAVSGQNVMLLAALVLFAGSLTGMGLRLRLLLAIGLIAVYVPLAGGGPSIQRAGVMGIAGLVAALAGHPARRWYALLLAAAVTLVLNPRAAAEPGWQLSFAAVASLLAAAPALAGALGRRMPAAVAEVAAITLAATVGTAPLMALHFGQLSLASLPANLIAAPAIAPVMWLGMLAAAAAQAAPALAAPFTALTGPLLVFIQWVAHESAGAPLAAVPVHAPPAAVLAIWAGAIGLFAAWMRRRRHRPALGGRTRRRRLAIPALAAVAVAGVTQARAGAPRLARGEMLVSFLDVGQGDATLIQLDGSAVLVDTGPPEGPVLERLRQAHVKRLDALVLTHAQADHEGAAPAVIREHDPRLVIDGGAGWSTRVQRVLAADRRFRRPQPRDSRAGSAARRIVAPAAGETLALGALQLRILWPPAPPPGWRPEGDPNQRAIVARVEAGRFSLLLTADAESDVTGPLALAPVDVLKVAHHGSEDAGLPALLERLRPRFAAIEVGRHNTYGHPAPSTIAALRRVVPTVVRTDRDGTVRLHAIGDRMWVER